MDLLNETVLLKTKSTLFNLLIRETLQFLCYERLLNMAYVAYKNAFFRIAIQCFHIKHYLDYHNTKFQPYTFRVQKMCVFARYATLVPRLIISVYHVVTDLRLDIIHTGKCIRRFGGIYAYCRYFIDRMW